MTSEKGAVRSSNAADLEQIYEATHREERKRGNTRRAELSTTFGLAWFVARALLVPACPSALYANVPLRTSHSVTPPPS